MDAPPGPPLVETKLRPPDRRTGLVARPELVARLDEAAGRHRLTLVSAAAGWGKTTLVGDWLAGSGRPAAWVALDASDNDCSAYVATGHYRVARYFSLTEHAMSPGVLIFSKRIWEELSKEDQTALRSAAKDSVTAYRTLQDDAETGSRSIVETAGVEIVTEVDKKSFVDAMVPLYPIALENVRVRTMVARVQAGN